jgi:hypothetical protein
MASSFFGLKEGINAKSVLLVGVNYKLLHVVSK